MSDPVDGGFVQSMARPGGNMTGFTSFEYSIGGKWIELLKEIVPTLSRVLVLYNPNNYTSRALLKTVMIAAHSLGIEITHGAVQNPAEIEKIVTAFGKEAMGAALLLPDPLVQSNQKTITELAAKYHLATLLSFDHLVGAG